MRRQGQVMLEVTSSALAATVACGGTFTDLRVASEDNVAAMYESSSTERETLAQRAAAYNRPDLLHASSERTAAMQVGYRKTFTPEFRAEAVKLVTETGRPVAHPDRRDAQHSTGSNGSTTADGGHSSLGMLTPVRCEQLHRQTAEAA